MNKNSKAGSVATESGFQNQQFAGANFYGFDVSNCATNTEKLQSDLVEHLKQHRKVIKLDQRCAGCRNYFTAKKMSRCLGICRNCFASAQDKGVVALGNFIAKAASNFQRIVREGLR